MKNQSDKIDLSLIMPALNEEENIARAIRTTLAAFSEYGLNGEIIVVNDGSTDKTAEIVESLIDREAIHCIRMIHHRTPHGLGMAFRDGMLEARGDVVAFMPGDGENDPGEIMRYFSLMEQVDMVVPFVYNKEVRPKSRNLISSIFRMIVNLSFGVNFNYTNGTVLYRRVILTSTPNQSRGFFFQTENVVRAVWSGYFFAEVPYRLKLRDAGESKAISWKSLAEVIRNYFSLMKELYFSPEKKLLRKPAPGTISDIRRSESQAIGLAMPGKYSLE